MSGAGFTVDPEALREDVAEIYGEDGFDLYADEVEVPERSDLLGPNLAELVHTLRTEGGGIHEPRGKRIVMFSCGRGYTMDAPVDDVFVGVQGKGTRLSGEVYSGASLIPRWLGAQAPGERNGDVELVAELVGTVCTIATQHARFVEADPRGSR